MNHVESLEIGSLYLFFMNKYGGISMEIKGIDVSSWQGNIDWKTVADYGMGFTILRITEKGLNRGSLGVLQLKKLL